MTICPYIGNLCPWPDPAQMVVREMTILIIYHWPSVFVCRVELRRFLVPSSSLPARAVRWWRTKSHFFIFEPPFTNTCSSPVLTPYVPPQKELPTILRHRTSFLRIVFVVKGLLFTRAKLLFPPLPRQSAYHLFAIVASDATAIQLFSTNLSYHKRRSTPVKDEDARGYKCLANLCCIRGNGEGRSNNYCLELVCG